MRQLTEGEKNMRLRHELTDARAEHDKNNHRRRHEVYKFLERYFKAVDRDITVHNASPTQASMDNEVIIFLDDRKGYGRKLSYHPHMLLSKNPVDLAREDSKWFKIFREEYKAYGLKGWDKHLAFLEIQY